MNNRAEFAPLQRREAPSAKAIRVRAALLGSAAVLALAPGWASAAERPPLTPIAATQVTSATDADAASVVTDVLVTARYRSESSQKVPIGITAITSQQIESLEGTFNLKQLMQQLPSLNIQGFSGRNQTTTIRGLGTNAGGTNDGLEQGVGLYIDGVYRPRTGTAITDLVDVDSIQLLRGPQGTLFGKNTVAGAIDIRTKEASFTREDSAEVTVGNYNYVRGALSLTGPITDDVAFRLSYLYTSREGLIYNTVYKKNWDDLNNNSVRGDLVYKPNDRLKIRATVDYSNQIGNVGFYSIKSVLPTTKANGSVVKGFYQHASDVGYTPIAIDPFARQVDLNSSQHDKMPSYGGQIRIDYQLGGFALTSISAYRNWRWVPHYDGDQIGADVSPLGIVATHQQQVSQEFRVASPTGQRLEYTAGLYYFYQIANDHQYTSYGTDAAKWLISPTAPDALLNGLVSFSHVTPATHSYAAYGQATYHLTPSWSLTGGLRYTYEQKTGSYDGRAEGAVADVSTLPAAWQVVNPLTGLTLAESTRAKFAPEGAYSAARTGDNISGTFSVSHDLTDDVHGYLSYSRGYKSAGINLVNQSLGVNIFVKPEQVDDYELGLKSQFFQRRLEVNANLFLTRDANYQANYIDTSVTPTAAYITNVGTAESRGVEFDVRASPIEGLNATLSAVYDEARYVSYGKAPAPYLTSYTGFKDLSGAEASGAPRWALGATVEYAHPLSIAAQSGLEGYIGGDFSLRSHFFGAVNDDIFSLVPGYQLFGAHAGLRSSKGWDASLWVRNLLDEKYFNTASVSASYGVALATLGEPRTFGVTLKAKY